VNAISAVCFPGGRSREAVKLNSCGLWKKDVAGFIRRCKQRLFYRKRVFGALTGLVPSYSLFLGLVVLFQLP
jgi:hypothetical protein